MALDYEVSRQVGVLESGGRVMQETRSYNTATGETVGLRSKEHAHDYRYFPEPDLVPLRIGEEWMQRIVADMPELPSVKCARFIDSYGLSKYDADVLTANRAIAEYFEKVAEAAGDPKMAANWVSGDLLGALRGREIGASPVSAPDLGELVKLIRSGEISGKLAKEIFAKMFETGDAARAIIDREGLKQISDTGALGKIADDIIAANPKQVEQYKSGKTTVLAFFVGQLMKATKGQANPAAVNEILREKLK